MAAKDETVLAADGAVEPRVPCRHTLKVCPKLHTSVLNTQYFECISAFTEANEKYAKMQCAVHALKTPYWRQSGKSRGK